MSKSAPSLHRTLHLQPHTHTGRVLHHKHTSYRGLAIVVILAGIVMLSLNMMARATADDLVVYARNPAPIPTTAAAITNPTDGMVVSKASLPVSGTCPVITPGIIVVITDNDTTAGSVPCDDNGRFSLTLTLSLGRHVLTAKTYTITNDTGPDSNPITVFRTEPASQTGPSTAIEQKTIPGSPLVVTIDEPFIIFGPAKDAIWLGTITGGTLPYAVHIDWGDNSSNTYTVAKSGSQHFTHHYRSMQPHIVVLHVTDAAGRSILHDYAAVTPYTPPVATIVAPTLPWGGSKPLGLYGIYLLLLALFGSLWIHAHRSRSFAYAKVPVRPTRPVNKRTKSKR